MPQPFHYAFFVRDLASTRHFYGEILGCAEGRSTDTWVDFDFFGNQISAHTTGSVTPTQHTGQVEGIQVPMPHFRSTRLPTRIPRGPQTLTFAPAGEHL
jgi:extradiol dioxygenase family protein